MHLKGIDLRERQLRRLADDEPSRGVHEIAATDGGGQIVARYECPCDWCETWRAAEPTMAAAVDAIDRAVLGDRK